MPDLARTLLLEQVAELHRRRRSGILAVTAGEVTKGLFLQHGRVVFASSTLDADKLGENLIRLGRINRTEFAGAYQRSQEGGHRLGHELVDAGLLSPDELPRLVTHHVRKLALSLFTWTEGQSEWHAGEEAVPADLALDLSTHRLLLEGARIFPDVARLEEALGNAQRTLRLSARPPMDYAAVPFSPAECAVMEGTADGQTLEEIFAGPLPRSLLVRAAYALLAAGVLEEADADGAVTVAPAERVRRLYEALPTATLYEVLDLAPEATAHEVEAAWQRLEDEHWAEWRPLETDTRMVSMISTLRLRRREAYRVLSEPERRAAYDRSREAGAEGPWVGSLNWTRTGTHTLTGTPSLLAGRYCRFLTWSIAASLRPNLPPAPETIWASRTVPFSSTSTLSSTVPSTRWRSASGG
jgi:hypothetical protein